MADLNKVFLIGRLTRDVELRHTEAGTPLCELSLAVNRKWSTKEGEKKEETLFVGVTVWNQTAERCRDWLAKGITVHIEGHLVLQTWDDRETGEKRSRIKVDAERVTFIERKDTSDNDTP